MFDLPVKRDGHDLLRLVVVERLEHELVEIVDVDGRRPAAAVSAGCSVKGSPGEQGQAETLRARERAIAIGDASVGSCARMAVADVGSGGRRRKKIAGALQSVQLLAWLEGWTNLPSQPIARAAWAAES